MGKGREQRDDQKKKKKKLLNLTQNEKKGT